MKKQILLFAVSSLALLGACQSLLPEIPLTNALGLDDATVDATFEEDLSATRVQPQGVAANLSLKGDFDDFDAPQNPVPITLGFTPQVKFARFKTCASSPNSLTLTFSKMFISVKDGIAPNERSHITNEVGPVNVLFTKTPDGKYEPDFGPNLGAFQGLFVAFTWQSILPIVSKSGVNTPNSAIVAFRLFSSDNSLKGCVVTLTFGAGIGKLKF